MLNERELFLSAFNGQKNVWVLAYGSLLWDPGFTALRCVPVVVSGWRRSFCLYSYEYRGTIECPGLVLGIEEGGYVESMALEVAAQNACEVMGYLWDREMITRAYIPCVVFADRSDKQEQLMCHSFAISSSHHQYAGSLSVDEKLEIILQAEGKSGPNIIYLLNTAKQLKKYSIKDPEIIEMLGLLAKKDPAIYQPDMKEY